MNICVAQVLQMSDDWLVFRAVFHLEGPFYFLYLDSCQDFAFELNQENEREKENGVTIACILMDIGHL